MSFVSGSAMNQQNQQSFSPIPIQRPQAQIQGQHPNNNYQHFSYYPGYNSKTNSPYVSNANPNVNYKMMNGNQSMPYEPSTLVNGNNYQGPQNPSKPFIYANNDASFNYNGPNNIINKNVSITPTMAPNTQIPRQPYQPTNIDNSPNVKKTNMNNYNTQYAQQFEQFINQSMVDLQQIIKEAEIRKNKSELLCAFDRPDQTYTTRWTVYADPYPSSSLFDDHLFYSNQSFNDKIAADKPKTSDTNYYQSMHPQNAYSGPTYHHDYNKETPTTINNDTMYKYNQTPNVFTSPQPATFNNTQGYPKKTNTYNRFVYTNDEISNSSSSAPIITADIGQKNSAIDDFIPQKKPTITITSISKMDNQNLPMQITVAPTEIPTPTKQSPIRMVDSNTPKSTDNRFVYIASQQENGNEYEAKSPMSFQPVKQSNGMLHSSEFVPTRPASVEVQIQPNRSNSSNSFNPKPLPQSQSGSLADDINHPDIDQNDDKKETINGGFKQNRKQYSNYNRNNNGHFYSNNNYFYSPNNQYNKNYSNPNVSGNQSDENDYGYRQKRVNGPNSYQNKRKSQNGNYHQKGNKKNQFFYTPNE